MHFLFFIIVSTLFQYQLLDETADSNSNAKFLYVSIFKYFNAAVKSLRLRKLFTFVYLCLPLVTIPYSLLPLVSIPYLSLLFLTFLYYFLPFLTFPYLSLSFLSFPYLSLPFHSLTWDLTGPYLALLGYWALFCICALTD